MLENGKFIQNAVKEGVKDIVASYNEAIDKFVADPDVRIAIKMSAGAGILQKMFSRLTDATKATPEDNQAAPEETEEESEVDPHSFPFGMTNWPDERF